MRAVLYFAAAVGGTWQARGVPAEDVAPARVGRLGNLSARRAQEEDPPTGANLNETVVPVCAPGYADGTGGKAYFWTCAFHCVSGPNYATAECRCACVTAEELERIRAGSTSSTTTQTTEEPTTTPPTAVGQGTLITSAGPSTSRQDSQGGISGFPVGDLGFPVGDVDPGQNPGPGSNPDLSTPEPSETPQERENRTDVETIAMYGGAATGGLCLLAVLAIGLCGLRRRRQRHPEETPAITLYKPREAAPDPSYDISVPGRPSSRASSKSSTGSHHILVGGSHRNSRSSSKNSSGSSRDAGTATDLEDALAAKTKPCGSATASIDSWAWGQRHSNSQSQRPSINSNHLTPGQRPSSARTSARTGSKCSVGSKQSRVQPDLGADRRASEASNLSVRDQEVPSWRRPSK